MAWRPHGRAKVDATSPSAFGICDRCSFLYNLCDLTWQFEWRGNSLLNLWLRVCKRCMDIPQEQLRPKVTPADPVPVYMPRVENYASADQGLPATDFSQPPLYVAEE